MWGCRISFHGLYHDDSLFWLVSVISGERMQRNGGLGNEPPVLRQPRFASIHPHIASTRVRVVGGGFKVDGEGEGSGGCGGRGRRGARIVATGSGGATRVRVPIRGSRFGRGLSGEGGELVESVVGAQRAGVGGQPGGALISRFVCLSARRCVHVSGRLVA